MIYLFPPIQYFEENDFDRTIKCVKMIIIEMILMSLNTGSWD